ncbi:hypothetical protein GGI42DRAFT_358911 [Trichoderma sp. SZMC 28013]
MNEKDPPEKQKKRDLKKQVAASITNVVCEGPCPGLLKISPLQSYQLKTSNVELQQELNPIAEVAASYVRGVEYLGLGKMATEINKGKLNVDTQYWKRWKIREVEQPA